VEPLSLVLRHQPTAEEIANPTPESKKRPEWKPYHSLVPFGKTDSVRGKFKLVIYSQEELEVKDLVEWKHKATSNGDWNGKTAGGSRHYQETWPNNPRFKLRLPKGNPAFTFCLMLSQQKSGVDLIAFQVLPYQFFIGYYILEDIDIVYEYKNWKNALDVWDVVTIDTTRESDFIIVPTTHKPDQCTTFSLTALADEEISFVM